MKRDVLMKYTSQQNASFSSISTKSSKNNINTPSTYSMLMIMGCITFRIYLIEIINIIEKVIKPALCSVGDSITELFSQCFVDDGIFDEEEFLSNLAIKEFEVEIKLDSTKEYSLEDMINLIEFKDSVSEQRRKVILHLLNNYCKGIEYHSNTLEVDLSIDAERLDELRANLKLIQ